MDGADLGKVKVEAVVAEHLKGAEAPRVITYRPKKRYRSAGWAPVALTRLEIKEDQRAVRRQDGAGAKNGAGRRQEEKEDDEMAHKKGLGSSRNGRDSQAKRLGVKVFAGQQRDRRRDHRAPARHALQAGPRRRHRPRRHDLRHARGHGEFTTGRKGRSISVDE